MSSSIDQINFRHDLLKNPEVLFQTFSTEKGIISALQSLFIGDRNSIKILDVGCGTGASLFIFQRCGIPQSRIYGVDILEERIAQAKEYFPSAHLICKDARSLPYQDNSFDIVYESTMFMQIIDEETRQKVASEMCRVASDSGAIILNDWRYNLGFYTQYRALTKKDIMTLFSPNDWQITRSFAGALIPPIGRFLSKYTPSLYFLFAKLPFIVGSKAWVLTKVKR